ncbi:MAG: YegP family protein [Firmicutes bacterium]|nr:YegP family protein [Bacillota bacterium]
MGKFVINDTKNGVKFNLKAGNGEIIAHSEVYSSLGSCKKGIASVIKNAPIAPVEDQTKEGFEKISNPKFEVYTDKKGEFRFRLRARNGQNIAASEGYTTMKACQNGIESVRKNAAEGNIERVKE